MYNALFYLLVCAFQRYIIILLYDTLQIKFISLLFTLTKSFYLAAIRTLIFYICPEQKMKTLLSIIDLS